MQDQELFANGAGFGGTQTFAMKVDKRGLLVHGTADDVAQVSAVPANPDASQKEVKQ